MWVVCIFSVSVISDGSGSHEQELEPAFLNVSSSEVAVSSYVVGGLGPVKCAPLPGDPREREGFAYFRTPEKGTQYYEDCKKTDNAVPRHMFPIPTVAGQYDYLIDENGLMRDAFPKDPLLQKSIKSRSNWTNANQLVRQTQTCRIAYPFTAVDSDQFSTIGMYSGKTPNDKTIMMPSTRACSAHCIKPATKNHKLHANGGFAFGSGESSCEHWWHTNGRRDQSARLHKIQYCTCDCLDMSAWDVKRENNIFQLTLNPKCMTNSNGRTECGETKKLGIHIFQYNYNDPKITLPPVAAWFPGFEYSAPTCAAIGCGEFTADPNPSHPTEHWDSMPIGMCSCKTDCGEQHGARIRP
jgi:hypothetical protein